MIAPLGEAPNWVAFEFDYGDVDEDRADDLVTGERLEEEWLQFVGPTGIVLLRMLVRLQGQSPDVEFEWSVEELACYCGVQPNVLRKTLGRLEQFRLLRELPDQLGYRVPMLVPPLPVRNERQRVPLRRPAPPRLALVQGGRA